MIGVSIYNYPVRCCNAIALSTDGGSVLSARGCGCEVSCQKDCVVESVEL